jgi:endonuclease YncB( thermonuclease family)
MSMKRFIPIIVAALTACASAHPSRYTRKQAQKSLTRLETAGLVVGEFTLTKVVDGDTVHVDGLDSSLRLLGLDTEETFKHPADYKQFESLSWEDYKKQVRGTSPRPVKFDTPMGMEAKKWAENFFAGVDKVRVERDDPKQIRDRYNRYLAYVFAQKNGVWLNYNVEAVRAGMAPYFPKYGRSRRFHEDFVKAEAEAKAAHRGIWAPGAQAYDDYPEREAWWTARGDFVAKFTEVAEANPNYISMDDFDATQRLEQMVGKEVVLLGTVADVYIGEKGPTRVTLSHGQHSDFPLIFFDRDVFVQSGIDQWKGEWVIATGVPSVYENKHTHKKQVQIVIDRASQIELSDVPGLKRPTVTTP